MVMVLLALERDHGRSLETRILFLKIEIPEDLHLVLPVRRTCRDLCEIATKILSLTSSKMSRLSLQLFLEKNRISTKLPNLRQSQNLESSLDTGLNLAASGRASIMLPISNTSKLELFGPAFIK